LRGITFVRFGCAAAAALLAGAVIAGPVLADSSAPTLTLPAVFAGVASVSGVYEHLDSVPNILPTSEPIFASLGSGTSQYAPQTLFARAVPYDPGDSIVGLPGLICTASSGAVCSLPHYPLVATANDQTPDASVGVLPALPAAVVPSVQALSGTAHADAIGGVSTDAKVGDALSQGAASASTPADSLTTVLHIGAIEGSTRQQFMPDGTLVVTAKAVDSDVDLLGGLIKIGSITATSVSKSNGTIHSHTDSASLGAVTVNGIPATIDDHGLSIAGMGVLPIAVLDMVTSVLDKALSALGISIQFVSHSSGSSVLNPSMCTSGEADGLQISASQNLRLPVDSGLYYDNIALASACTTVTVGAPVIAPSTPPVVPPPSGGGVTSPISPVAVGGGAVGPTSGPTSSGGTPTPGQVALPAVGNTTPGSSSRPVSLEAELGTNLVSDRLQLLYLVFGLASLAILLGGVPFLKPRLPGRTG
jgi:hypothetical protein